MYEVLRSDDDTRRGGVSTTLLFDCLPINTVVITCTDGRDYITEATYNLMVCSSCSLTLFHSSLLSVGLCCLPCLLQCVSMGIPSLGEASDARAEQEVCNILLFDCWCVCVCVCVCACVCLSACVCYVRTFSHR